MNDIDLLKKECEFRLRQVKETIDRIDSLHVENEQFVLDFLDELNKLSVKW